MGLDRSDSQNCIGVGQLSIEVRGFHERDIYIYIYLYHPWAQRNHKDSICYRKCIGHREFKGIDENTHVYKIGRH